jgi:putative phosphoesterase
LFAPGIVDIRLRYIYSVVALRFETRRKLPGSTADIEDLLPFPDPECRLYQSFLCREIQFDDFPEHGKRRRIFSQVVPQPVQHYRHRSRYCRFTPDVIEFTMVCMRGRQVNSAPNKKALSIGVLSDTHGLLRPEAVTALQGCEMIIHAGDVGSPEILEILGRLARVHAVRGNVDRDAWADRLPHSAVVDAAGKLLYVVHDVADLDLDPAAAGFAGVISGHSHHPRVQEINGVLYINPGSAGPKRFRLPVCVARLRIVQGELRAQVVTLDV